jgi:succinate-semialdehyde dehydrogenase/glutarate-semialdehyde dehydrogenase
MDITNINMFKSINPFDQQVIALHPLHTDAMIAVAFTTAAEASSKWKRFTFDKRAELFLSLSALLRVQKLELAQLITSEMGKVLSEAEAEIEKCAWVCEYYATNTAQLLQDEQVVAGYTQSFITHQPLGIVLGIMPWNFPFWQVFRYAVPALMAGNVTLLKHAPNVMGCAKKIETLLLQAGAMPGLLQSLVIEEKTLAQLLAHPAVQAVTFTGSTRAGREVASLAGRHIKKQVLELGGSDACIILPDANMQEAAQVVLQSRMLNAGQSCIGAKRIIVLASAYDDFMTALQNIFPDWVQGNPLDARVTVGPMARPDLAAHLRAQWQQSVNRGAQILAGGEVNGCLVQPTLISQVVPGMQAFDEETFGPLATVITAESEFDAIALANQSQFGLADSIWTADTEKAVALARELEAGAVFINSMVKSDPRLPFGGIKNSGYGRELGRYGLLEFVNIKSIVVQ